MENKKSKRGKLIVFEGPNGVGKTTIASQLNELRRDKVRSVYCSFPGKNIRELGDVVYYFHSKSGICPESLQALHLSAHLDIIQNVIKPNLNCGVDVILDRYWWSLEVYGKLHGIDKSLLKHFISSEKVFWGDIEPYMIFLLERTGASKELSKLYGEIVSRESCVCKIVNIQNDGNLEGTLNYISRKLVEGID